MAMTKPLSTISLALSYLFCCGYLSEGAEISIVDQSNEVANAQGAIGTTADNRARFQLTEAVQTFTAGVSGNLTQVDVLINAWIYDVYFPLRIEIQPTDLLGRPYSSIAPLVEGKIGLFRRVEIPEPTWMSLRFPMPGISLTAGNVYAIVASSGDNDGYRWFGSVGDLYPRGNSYYRYNYPAYNRPWNASFDQSFDFTFRTHMAITVPEPSKWRLVGVIVYFAVHRRERQRRTSAGERPVSSIRRRPGLARAPQICSSSRLRAGGLPSFSWSGCRAHGRRLPRRPSLSRERSHGSDSPWQDCF